MARRELLGGQHAEHVGLVLGRDRRAPVQRGPSRAEPARSGRCTTASKPSASARSSTAANLIFSLQRRHGLGVRPRGVLGDEVVDHVVGEPLGQVPDVERDAEHVGGPAGVAGVLQRAAAARTGPVRAAGSRTAPGGRPVTSCPASTARAAATAESTPPDMAASTAVTAHRASPARATASRSPAARGARSTTSPMHRAERRRRRPAVRGVAEREPQRAAGPGLVRAHREQHVAGLGDARPCRPSRSSSRCPARRAASAARRPRSRGTRSARCPAAGRGPGGGRR